MKWLEDPSLGLVPGVRPNQLAMAKHVADVFENGGFAAIQAGTGSGKSLSYLVPAVTSGLRVVVSTARKSLQTQLTQKELPAIHRVVKPIVFTALKGKGNYFCQLRFDGFVGSGAAATLGVPNAEIEAVDAWAAADPSGDLDALPGVRYASHYNVAECAGARCEHHGGCAYYATREKARVASVLVVNHSLLAYDLRLGGGKILGKYDALVIDEAHQFMDYATKAYTHTLATTTLAELERASLADHRVDFPSDLPAAYKKFMTICSRTAPGVFEPSPAVERLVAQINGGLGDLRATFKRCGAAVDVGGKIEEATGGLGGNVKLQDAVARLDRLEAALAALTAPDGEAPVRFQPILGEPAPSGYQALEIAPLEIGPLVAPALLGIGKVVVTSATLETADGLDFRIKQFGLMPNQVKIKAVYPSPFDYKARSGFWVTQSVPAPVKGNENKDAMLAAQIEEAYALIAASDGGAFVVCPSYADLRALATALVPRLAALGITSIVQTDAALDPLVDEFKTGWRNVLFGTKGLAEGIDVPGLKLRLVVVTRLMFPHFNDVLNRCRRSLLVERMVRGGTSPAGAERMAFDKLDLQLAANDLAQAAGRLMRHELDAGIFAVLDPRLREGAKGYSAALRKLIPHPVCRTQADALKMLRIVAGAAKQRAGEDWTR